MISALELTVTDSAPVAIGKVKGRSACSPTVRTTLLWMSLLNPPERAETA